MSLSDLLCARDEGRSLQCLGTPKVLPAARGAHAGSPRWAKPSRRALPCSPWNKEVSVLALHRPDNHRKSYLLRIRRRGTSGGGPEPPLSPPPWISLWDWVAVGDLGQGWSWGDRQARELAHGAQSLGTPGLGLPVGLHTRPSKARFGGPLWDQLGGHTAIFLLLLGAMMGTRDAPCHGALKATQCSQSPLKPQDGIISHRETESRIWGRPLASPLAASNKDEGTRGRQPVSGMGLRFLPRFPEQR